MNTQRLVLALFVILLAAADAAAVVTQTPYQITAGGTYQYKPPGFSGGYPGGMPSPFQLDFGIGGSFVYELDTDVPTARLLNLDLVLTGNEAVQAAYPGSPVTADGVEVYLAGHVFVTDFIGGLLHLKSSATPGLKLSDSLNGHILVRGGYDGTFVDGDARQFEFNAVAVPEPASAALLAMAGVGLLRRRRKRGSEHSRVRFDV